MEARLLIEEFIINYGLISIFIVVALEYANFPLPSEVVLPLIGILGPTYGFKFSQVLLISILAGVFGSLINYYLGWKFGKPLLGSVMKKFPNTKKSIKSSYSWLKKYDKISVMLSRLVPLARTFISIVAGVVKMNLILFTVYSAIGIGIWNTILIGIGYIIGDNIELIGTIMKRYSLGLVLIGIIFICIYLYKNKKRKST